MFIDDQRIRDLLLRIVARVEKEPSAQEDLLQEGLMHLWQMEERCPGQRPSWYLQGFYHHIRNCARRGRSLDAQKHRHAGINGIGVTEAIEEQQPEPGADEMVFQQASANDIMAQLADRLHTREVTVLLLLNDGFSLREAAARLNVSHTAIEKRRRKIAATPAETGRLRHRRLLHRESRFAAIPKRPPEPEVLPAK